MKMKKLTGLLALLLALAMVLCACGETREDVGGSVTPTTGEETLPEGNTMSIGRIEGGTYTNEYMGFAMDLDSTWQYYTADELQELPDNVAEMFEGTEVGDAIDTVSQFTDMMAESVEQLASVNVLYQKMDMQTRLLYAAMDDETILDATLAQSDALIDAYSAAGIDVSDLEKVTVNFLGQERVALKTTSTMQGVDYYTLQVFDYHLGQYSVTITFASFIEDKTEALAAMCYPIG